MNNIEILAPAGSVEALKTAVQNGADAVYLGLQDFNARISADNFTTENIRQWVQYAHFFGTKVYLTVNTLVNNDEMPKLVQTVRSAVEAKVDAFLVQDFGVFSVLKDCFPNINLHASTQLGVHNLYGAQVAEKMGFKRIVLSRETKLEDIKQIKQNTNLEIEYFVQGALCIAFSGNCYFSGMLQGDSGNRGRCKQYCRMKYTPNMQSEKLNEKYMLSARDLCLIHNLKQLIDAGVTSFKIEGRLRREGYVAQTVQSFRRALDSIQQNKKCDLNNEEFLLSKVFNRGKFNTNAYLNKGVPDDVVNVDVQNHFGIEVGKVAKVEPFKDLQKVTIVSSHNLSTGDGLKFLDNGTQICSLGVGNVDKKDENTFVIYTKHKLKPGYTVNLILDSFNEQQLTSTTKKLGISAKVVAKAGKPMSCQLTYKNIQCTVQTAEVLEKAQKCVTTTEEIVKQLSKLGDTNFFMEKCVIQTDGVFVPKSVANSLRRDAVEKLAESIVLSNEKNITANADDQKIEKMLKNKQKISEKSTKNPVLCTCVMVVDEDCLPEVCANKDKLKDCLIVFSPKQFSKQNLQNFAQTLNGLHLGLNLPVIANACDLQILDGLIDSFPDLTLVANNIYGLHYIKTHHVVAGVGLNVFNDYAKSYLNTLGVCAVLMSVEQQFDKMQDKQNLFVYSLGFLPLMTFAHCPYKTVFKNTCNQCKFKQNLCYTDVLNNVYPIRRYTMSQCYFELLHSKLINNLGLLDCSCWLDVRNLNDKQLKTLFTSLNKKQEINLSSTQIVGKVFEAVK